MKQTSWLEPDAEDGASLSFSFLSSNPPNALQVWPPDLSALAEGWCEPVQAFMHSPVGQELSERVQAALAAGATIYPNRPFRALELTALPAVRVLILGQDPYHGPGQAEGLAFSVPQGQRLPPSLRNVFKEIERSPGAQSCSNSSGKAGPNSKPSPNHRQGSLVHWAEQGVLLLNTCLTVQAGQPASHAAWGWEMLTDALVQAVARRPEPVVFMLWGTHAQAKTGLIEQALPNPDQALILTANHPSPLSALRPPKPFIGCDHFAQCNAFLRQQGGVEVDWMPS